MPLEYEYPFKNYDKNIVLSKMKENGAKKEGHYIFRVIVFIHPLNTPNTYIRVRDEGKRITMTYKYKNPDVEFEDENEVIIDNFDQAVNILYGIGCKKKYYYEKMREIWILRNSEIVFDNTPGVPEVMEIESKTKKELDSITKLLDLTEYKYIRGKTTTTTEELYGFKIPSTIDLLFKTVKKVLGDSVIKNKKIFNKVVGEQKKLYNSLIK